MSDRQLIVPQGMERIHSDFGYAPGIRTGPILHIAGQVGRDEMLRPIEDLRGQIARAWENVLAVVDAAGGEPADLVDIVSYHVGGLAAQLTIFKEERDRLLGPTLALRPCWTAVGVTELSRPALLVEIKATAYLPNFA